MSNRFPLGPARGRPPSNQERSSARPSEEDHRRPSSPPKPPLPPPSQHSSTPDTGQREPPKGPRALLEPSRGSGPNAGHPPSGPPRGRNPFGSRGEARERPFRANRDAREHYYGRGVDRERDHDRRNSNPPREPASWSRDADTDLSRGGGSGGGVGGGGGGNSRALPRSTSAASSDPPARGGFGRGRDDRQAAYGRSRGRHSSAERDRYDERGGRQHERWRPNNNRDDRDKYHHHQYHHRHHEDDRDRRDRTREESKRLDREEREREAEKYKRDRQSGGQPASSWHASGSNHGTNGSAAASMSPLGGGLDRRSSVGSPLEEARNVRHNSVGASSGHGGRHGYSHSRADVGPGRPVSRPTTPPQAPQVPAFGSVPFRPSSASSPPRKKPRSSPPAAPEKTQESSNDVASGAQQPLRSSRARTPIPADSSDHARPAALSTEIGKDSAKLQKTLAQEPQSKPAPWAPSDSVAVKHGGSDGASSEPSHRAPHAFTDARQSTPVAGNRQSEETASTDRKASLQHVPSAVAPVLSPGASAQIPTGPRYSRGRSNQWIRAGLSYSASRGQHNMPPAVPQKRDHNGRERSWSSSTARGQRRHSMGYDEANPAYTTKLGAREDEQPLHSAEENESLSTGQAEPGPDGDSIMAEASPQPPSIAYDALNGDSQSQGPTLTQEAPEVNVEFDEVFDEIWRKKNAQAEAYIARKREENEGEMNMVTSMRDILIHVVEALSYPQMDQEPQVSADAIAAYERAMDDAAPGTPAGNDTVLGENATNGATVDDDTVDDNTIMEGIEDAGVIEIPAVGEPNAGAIRADTDIGSANVENTSMGQTAAPDAEAIGASDGEGTAIPSITQAGQQTQQGTRQESPDVTFISERRAPTPPVDTLPYLAATILDREPNEHPEWKRVDAEYCRQRFEFMSLVRQADEKETQEKEASKQKYAQDLRAWFRHVESVDADSTIQPTADNHDNASARMVAVAAAATAPSTSPMEGRRGGRFGTEYDLQRVLRESELAAAEVSQGSSDRGMQTNNSVSKYATLLKMDKKRLPVLDLIETNRRLTRDHLNPQIRLLTEGDDFTPEEHQRFVAAVSRVPAKQWRRLADAVGNNRTPLDCIRHYYWTKESVPYKDLFRHARGRRPRQTTQSSRLIQRAIPVEDDDPNSGALALTETGRPRRAAAPTFGEPPTAVETGMVAQPTRRRAGTGSRQEGENAQADRGSRRGRGGGAARERGQRRPRGGQPVAVVPLPPVDPMEVDPSHSMVPPIDDRVEERVEQMPDVEMTPAPVLVQTSVADNDIIVVDDEVPATVPQSEAAPSEPSPIPSPIPVHAAGPVPTSVPVPSSSASAPAHTVARASPSREPPPRAPRSQQRGNGTTSSYWSVPESAIFPQLLAYYGTDWKAIADYMKTKTHNMVKNYYKREIESGQKNWPDIVEQANARISLKGNSGPPPPLSQPKRKHDASKSSMPQQRPLAPSTNIAVAPESKKMQAKSPLMGINLIIPPTQAESSPPLGVGIIAAAAAQPPPPPAPPTLLPVPPPMLVPVAVATQIIDTVPSPAPMTTAAAPSSSSSSSSLSLIATTAASSAVAVVAEAAALPKKTSSIMALLNDPPQQRGQEGVAKPRKSLSIMALLNDPEPDNVIDLTGGNSNVPASSWA